MQTKERIGDLNSAMTIYEADRSEKIPDGWSRVGSGCYRNVYRCPKGTVYKVCKSGYNSSEDNAEEYIAYQNIVDNNLTKEGWCVAPVDSYSFIHGSTHVTVNTMEFVEGEHEQMTGSYEDHYADYVEIDAAFKAFGLIDGHVGNYIVTGKGEKVIIDLAS